MSDSCVSVVTAELITCGTLLGPLPLNSGAPDSLAVLTWRCVDKLTTAKQVLKVTLRDQANGRSHSKAPSWLSHILPARNPEEQTLEVVVKGGQLYFRALRDINSGEELRAWFGQDLADILKLPMIPPMTIEDEKRYECMLCQEQFENPFPVVAHLMYRCRRKDQGITPMQNPFPKKNGGRVKNFDIATLTDMNENENVTVDERNSSPVISSPNSEVGKRLAIECNSERQIESSNKRKRSLESTECSTSPKKVKTDCKSNEEAKNVQSKSISSHKSHNSAFKLSSPSGSSEYLTPLHSRIDINHNESNSSSAFKKVDKSNAAFHSNVSPVPNLFPSAIDPRDILFQGGPNGFSPFPYPLPSAANSPPCGGATLPQNGTTGVPHPIFTTTPVDVHMTSAFVPSGKLPTTVSTTGTIHQQLKMAEELKAMRKIPNLSDGYDLSALLPSVAVNGSRMPTMAAPLNYAPKTQTLESFAAAKGFPTPLIPFLPPSLAALSFPTQNWCAKCNASFRMTSDLVYHMRSHHKRETDPQKLKREEKLRCHICNETFRERHHLTRHMTSHQ